ncbi:MarR family transcriptional regulator [Streptomyces sp. NBC_00234]|uniref:MarR family winged helix-turn-helix transcriptional regulator n=1 Tax=Streptomyces sp. NBC_00234 TaxID=2903638 RepID=UPI002E28114D|nr:MarR family transcriptional regulator [Streptomyces sp. NBC_00234]
MPPNRRTDADEQQTTRAFLVAARVLSERLGQELRRENGMLPIHYELLARLSESPGRRLKMTDLARNAGVSASRLSHLADRLEERGWIGRTGCPADGRVHLAQLTRAGRRALDEAASWPPHGQHTGLLEILTREEMVQLRDMSERLRSGLDVPEQAAPP